jgi:hypothetical protein
MNLFVIDIPTGRLGNAIFRYLASSVFSIIYNTTKRIQHSDENLQKCVQHGYSIMNDEYFIGWKDLIEYGTEPNMGINTIYIFNGYFQHDTIYVKYKSALLKHIERNQNDILISEVAGVKDIYYAKDLIVKPPNTHLYDVVVHIRLEDFVTLGQVIHPESIHILLDSIQAPSYYFVVNNPTTDIEIQYLEYFSKRFNVILESNDVITDYHIMRNAKTLVCSCSTLSWVAALMSVTVQTVYMPNYKRYDRPHETFRKPIENTIAYEYKTCSKEELEEFLRTAV